MLKPEVSMSSETEGEVAALAQLQAYLQNVVVKPEDCVAPSPVRLANCRTMSGYVRRFSCSYLRMQKSALGRICVAKEQISDGTFIFGENPIVKNSDLVDSKLDNALSFAATTLHNPLPAATQCLIFDFCDSTELGSLDKAFPSNMLVKRAAEVLKGGGELNRIDEFCEARQIETRKGKRWRESMLKLMGIYLSNAHLVSATGEAGLFPLTAMINHSCSPNCAFTTDEEGVLYVVATDTIEVDEELTLSYIDDISEQPLRERRRELKHSFAFHCECEQCADEEQAVQRKRKRARI
jgi:hypothetical protein